MKLIYKLFFFAFVSMVLISCNSTESPLITSLKTQNVVIGSGFNAKNGKHIVFSPFTGEKVKPCRSPSANTNTYAKGSIHPKGCGIEIVESDNIELLKDAIKASNMKIIDAIIIRNGKRQEAQVAVTVSAFYKGSICGTIWHGGVEYYCCNNQCTRA